MPLPFIGGLALSELMQDKYVSNAGTCPLMIHKLTLFWYLAQLAIVSSPLYQTNWCQMVL